MTLADKLRLWADGDVLETARDGTFEYNDAVKWAALMEDAADRIEALEQEAAFLLERLQDLENGWDDEEAYRDFCGHVAPSAARLRSLLQDEVKS